MTRTPVSHRDLPQTRALQRLLLRCAADATPAQLPGVDGLTVSEVLREYRRLAACHAVPGPQELRVQHPELAVELDSFFASRSHH